ncbi:MAG: spermidine synthase, partial [Acidobacteriota bacterium]
AVERASDEGRRVTGLIYAVNTLGAVGGALLTTFVAIEMLGVRRTVWTAALLNLLLAIVARSLARTLGEAPPSPDEAAPAPPGPAPRAAPAGLVIVAAAVVGCVFLLMELVWYRMLGPLLGGSSYSFGLILAVALAGIGLGGLAYEAGARERRPTLLSFAGTCTLEAFFLALPLFFGDRVAVVAAILRGAAALGFPALVGSWSIVAALVALLPAAVAGYQFPLLVALLGRGSARIGREVGRTYAANTLGSIVGSIAGGFGLLPLLTAPGVWRLCVVALVGLGGLTLWRARAARWQQWALPVVAGALALGCLSARGPTAFWRHSPIGAGRMGAQWQGPNDVRATLGNQRRTTVWEADGVESAVALSLDTEYAFIINGKSDGSAIGDAPTQVMSGLLGAMLHPDPRRALVIGLGTGSTAGWLAQVPSIERVDVAELEPVVRHVAEVLAPINRNALTNPKVKLWLGDGRELLLTGRDRYDLVFSEPSNPYRAGVASLFSVEFYRAVERRLGQDGVFLQWLQGYEVDAQLVRTAYATLGAVFPAVESWQVQNGDLLLVASRRPIVHDLERVRARAATEPFRTALENTWGVGGAAGFYSGFIGGPAFARAVGAGAAGETGGLNTDDHPVLEFGFARNLGRLGLFEIGELVRTAAALGEDSPAFHGAGLDGDRWREMRSARAAYWRGAPPPGEARLADAAARHRDAARWSFAGDDMGRACAEWFAQSAAPAQHVDLLLVGSCLAERGDARALDVAVALGERWPVEADFVRTRYLVSRGDLAGAGERLLAAIAGYRRDAWVYRPLVRKTLPLVLELGARDRALAERFYVALGEPFAIDMFHSERLILRFGLAGLAEPHPQRCAEALAPFEPNPMWEEHFLSLRAECYARLRSPLRARAAADLERFRADAPPRITIAR